MEKEEIILTEGQKKKEFEYFLLFPPCNAKVKNVDNKPYFDLIDYVNYLNHNDSISGILAPLPLFEGKKFLSALGARVCYAKEDVKTLLENDFRITNQEERYKFLSKLGFNYYHTSVFSHSFEYIQVYPKETNLKIHPFMFKSVIPFISTKEYFGLDKFTLGVSLRHIIEIAAIKKVLNQRRINDYLEFVFLDSELEIKEKENIEKTLYWINDKYKHFKYVRPIFLELPYFDRFYCNEECEYYPIKTDGWIVFAIENASRIMTHQLVRHTKLNFSQRSQRYIDEGLDEPLSKFNNLEDFISQKVVIPESIKFSKETLNTFCNIAFDALEFYNKVRKSEYLKKQVKKEDIRFILPHGFKTTILVSGTVEDIKDWIEKRIIPQAQWEIRAIAEELNEFLKNELES